MGIAEGPAEELDVQHSSDVRVDLPVMVGDWAELVIDLGRWQSRRRHPSNPEPSWEKDGGYEAMEWIV